MAYDITFTKAVREQIRRLPGNIKAVAKHRIAELSDNPRLPRSKDWQDDTTIHHPLTTIH